MESNHIIKQIKNINKKELNKKLFNKIAIGKITNILTEFNFSTKKKNFYNQNRKKNKFKKLSNNNINLLSCRKTKKLHKTKIKNAINPFKDSLESFEDTKDETLSLNKQLSFSDNDMKTLLVTSESFCSPNIKSPKEKLKKNIFLDFDNFSFDGESNQIINQYQTPNIPNGKKYEFDSPYKTESFSNSSAVESTMV